jgi:uncharacterized protein
MKIVLMNGLVIADKVMVADTYFKRLRGLLGKTHLESGEGLLLTHCSSVHCFFMKFTIDVVYLSTDMVVLGTETIHPWRIGKFFRDTVHVLELEEGALGIQLKKGDQLYFEDTV